MKLGKVVKLKNGKQGKVLFIWAGEEDILIGVHAGNKLHIMSVDELPKEETWTGNL